MIIITCPNNNIPERTYAIEVFFGDVLGCEPDDYSIQFADITNYEMVVDDKTITIEDHFFNHYVDSLSYLKLYCLPQKLSYFHAFGMEIPIIYGVDKYLQDEKAITIGLDIFASTFFMLTRWEEELLGRQEKGDCDETQLFCVKNKIHQRPIVNEYAELLCKLLSPNIPVSNRNYEVILAHDVDGFLPHSWPKILWNMIKHIGRKILGKKTASFTWREQIDYKKHYPDPYVQFEMYTTLAQKYGIEEWFYFKVCGRGEREATYFFDDNRTKDIINRLKAKKSLRLVLGFHPSQNVFKNPKQWNKEVFRIIGLLKEKPFVERNHHLLYNYETYRQLEGIKETPINMSNCVFHKRLGFRSGICIPYHVFDLYQQRKMNIIETPGQIMDTALRLHEYKTAEDEWKDIVDIINMVKKYNGCLVLTWHIYVTKRSVIMEYYNICDKVLERATKHNY